jgi:hypothetical protein
MEDNEKEKEELFNKGISFFNENLYSMALYYFVPSKTVNNDDIVDDYIKKCNEKIKERQKANVNKQYLNQRERQFEENAINVILQSNNNYEILGLKQNATKEQVTEAYKKLAVKYHPDVNTSAKSEELLKKITKSYNKIINNSNNEINPYELMDKVFKEDDLVELMNNEKSNLELKQFSIPPAAKGISTFIQLSIFFYIFVYFVLPYFYPKSSELYDFVHSVSNPYEKTSKRFKVKYYVGNEFKEKYVSHREIREIEKEIENKYLGFLNKTCQETKEEKEKMTKRLIYYKKGTLIYDSIITEISKVDLSICDKFDKYSKKYETVLKNENNELNNDDNTDNDSNENDNNDNDNNDNDDNSNYKTENDNEE